MPTFTHTIENHNLLYFSSFFFVFLVFCFAIYFLNSLSFFAFVPCDEPLHLYLPNIVVVFYLKLRFVIFLFDDFHIYHSLNWWPYDWITQNWSPLVAQSHESVTTNADPNAPNNWTTIFFRPVFLRLLSSSLLQFNCSTWKWCWWHFSLEMIVCAYVRIRTNVEMSFKISSIMWSVVLSWISNFTTQSCLDYLHVIHLCFFFIHSSIVFYTLIHSLIEQIQPVCSVYGITLSSKKKKREKKR